MVEWDKKVPYELLEANATIGASRGWVATLNSKGVVCLQDDLNVYTSDSADPKRISLPPILPIRHCQTRIVTNVAMSSSSPLNDDCVVAVKFLGPQLSLCRPAHDTKWTNIRVQDPSFFTSHVIFSKRDQMFSLPASGANHLASWDLLKHRDNPKFTKLHFHQNLPGVLGKTNNLEPCDSWCRAEHLVESSAGEMFLVIWYRSAREDMVDLETKGFRVFRVDEGGNATYTEDIGDLCIFLSKSEPFCVPASSFPGLERNNIYYLDSQESSFTQDVGIFGLQDSTSNHSTRYTGKVPYYFPPQPMQ
ncbi:PREDICTED: uncharacterized protein LOC104769198 [Camelina sativa]|uniref:Uncharacterized protein LOC104769198 n=1 Tax=Camelina sativa TaxID=90675 RepID=A0ABM0XVL6_CAMSA|nr:PREDICTED: uncharacterized protein LOC104769198 [Camelina sativa]